MADTDYKSTLRLPKTDFPMKANLPKREPDTLKKWDEIGIYELLMKTRADAPAWVLHDGPPYANGRVHPGTALNKILKDFVVRSRSMMGLRTPFVPGWDCHGMPIGLKVSRDLGERARSISKIELRALCRAEAEKWIDLQRSDFRRLGCIGDWFNPYLTMAPAYEAAEIGVLHKLVEDGYIYRGMRPVLWCFSCRTGLAEAEVEYSDHRSPSIYVAYPVNESAGDAGALAADSADAALLSAAHKAGKLFAVIWTTTPWTLPASLGVSLNDTFDYVALKVGDRFYIVASRLADDVAVACSLDVERRIPLSREALHALDGKDVFNHPFLDRAIKLMYGEHVTADTGTGLVHTAPGHGYEDFVIGAQYRLKPFSPVDDAGVFTKDGGEWAGRNVFQANPSIVERLKALGALLHSENISHSYPHCWRCKNPLIFRATDQWFMRIDHNRLREKIVAGIDGVKWVPAWSRERIRNMTETRPDWNLSRQLAWGVPIPALKCEGCGQVTLDLEVIKRTQEIFSREGSDAWYVRPVSDFAPAGFKCPHCGGASFRKEEDILDVWFDSGSSQAAVLACRPELTWPADAYLEAVEQARGWFGSSLACAVAERGHAPFRTVINHGLTLDEQGRKMSKSLGNFEDTIELVNRLGADVLRLVYASLDYSSDMNLGPTVFSAVAESYRKLRNTCRFILGNLADFDPSRDLVAAPEMLEFDRYILARAEKFKGEVRRAYDSYDFQAVYHAALNFAVVDLSSLYIDVARDRLYCARTDSRERRSAQTALYLLLDMFVRVIAPLVPYTAEEVYAHIPGTKQPSVHLLTFADPHPEYADPDLVNRWDRMLRIRAEALKLLESMRQAGTIGAPLEARVSIAIDSAAEHGLGEVLSKYRDSLKELFIVSEVEVLGAGEAAKLREMAAGRNDFSSDGTFARIAPDLPLALVGRRAGGRKCQRCWVYYDDEGDPELCPRCRAVVRA